jgi:hypothetical protein
MSSWMSRRRRSTVSKRGGALVAQEGGDGVQPLLDIGQLGVQGALVVQHLFEQGGGIGFRLDGVRPWRARRGGLLGVGGQADQAYGGDGGQQAYEFLHEGTPFQHCR